jgi:hypothetical protein
VAAQGFANLPSRAWTLDGEPFEGLVEYEERWL